MYGFRCCALESTCVVLYCGVSCVTIVSLSVPRVYGGVVECGEVSVLGWWSVGCWWSSSSSSLSFFSLSLLLSLFSLSSSLSCAHLLSFSPFISYFWFLDKKSQKHNLTQFNTIQIFLKNEKKRKKTRKQCF